MNNGLKLFWLTGLVSAVGLMTLQGCGDDGEADGTGGSAGAGGKGAGGASGGSGGSSGGSGGASGGSGGKGAGGSGGASGGSGGASGGSGGSTGGTGGTGEGGDGGDGNPQPSQACLTFCTGEDSIGMVCGDDERFPAEWEGAGCLSECAGFDGDALECWQTHLDNAMSQGTEAHCGHAVGDDDPGQTQCPER